jgi:hypothetical protein
MGSLDPGPDPRGEKLPTKMGKKLKKFIFEVLDVLFWGLKASPGSLDVLYCRSSNK